MKKYCIDCSCEITNKNKGAKYPNKDGMERYKCIECYKEKPEISQETECYSRVVGYLRPVKQWNLAKRVEYKARVVFKPEYKDYKKKIWKD